MSVTDTNRTLVVDAYQAIADGNVKGFLGILHPEIVVSEPACLPYGGTFTGIKDVIGMLGQAGPYLDSAATVVEYVVADGDRVAVLLSIPLRDGSGTASIAEHWVIRDGKAVELTVFWSDPSMVPVPA